MSHAVLVGRSFHSRGHSRGELLQRVRSLMSRRSSVPPRVSAGGDGSPGSMLEGRARRR